MKFRVTVSQIMTTVHTIEADSADDLQEVVGELGSDGLAQCRTETLDRKWEIQRTTTIERWAFLASELDNLQACKAEDEFVAYPALEQTELGVIVGRNGQVSNRWEDGTVGIPPEVREVADETDSLHSLSGEEIIGWRDVEVSEDGQPLRLCEVTP